MFNFSNFCYFELFLNLFPYIFPKKINISMSFNYPILSKINFIYIISHLHLMRSNGVFFGNLAHNNFKINKVIFSIEQVKFIFRVAMMLDQSLRSFLYQIFVHLDHLNSSLSNLIIFTMKIVDKLIKSILVKLFRDGSDFSLFFFKLRLFLLLNSFLLFLFKDGLDFTRMLFDLFGGLLELGSLFLFDFFLFLLLKLSSNGFASLLIVS